MYLEGDRGVLVSRPGIQNVQQLKRYAKGKANEGSKVARYTLMTGDFDPRVKNYRWGWIWGLGRFGGSLFIEEVETSLNLFYTLRILLRLFGHFIAYLLSK